MANRRIGSTDQEATGTGDHIRNTAHRRIHLFQSWLPDHPPKDMTPLSERLWHCGLQHANDAPIAGSVGNRPVIKTDLWLEASKRHPDESHAFAEFSAAHLPERVHEAFIKES